MHGALVAPWRVESFPTRIEPSSPTLTGRLLSTVLPEKSLSHFTFALWEFWIVSWTLWIFVLKTLELTTTLWRMLIFVAVSFSSLSFPDGSDGKECLQCQRPVFSPWVRKILWSRKWQSTPEFLPGKSHGQRSLAGYSPQNCKELDTTEQQTLSLITHLARDGRFDLAFCGWWFSALRAFAVFVGVLTPCNSRASPRLCWLCRQD